MCYLLVAATAIIHLGSAANLHSAVKKALRLFSIIIVMAAVAIIATRVLQISKDCLRKRYSSGSASYSKKQIGNVA